MKPRVYLDGVRGRGGGAGGAAAAAVLSLALPRHRGNDLCGLSFSGTETSEQLETAGNVQQENGVWGKKRNHPLNQGLGLNEDDVSIL